MLGYGRGAVGLGLSAGRVFFMRKRGSTINMRGKIRNWILRILANNPLGDISKYKIARLAVYSLKKCYWPVGFDAKMVDSLWNIND